MTGKLWFRMYTEFMNDPKVQMMSEAMQRRLVMLFCARCGAFLGTSQGTSQERELAFSLRITEEQLADTKALFIAQGFIDEDWNLINWDKRQYQSDSSTVRTRRYRERMRTSQGTSQERDVTAKRRRGDGYRAEQNRAEQSVRSRSMPSISQDSLPGSREEREYILSNTATRAFIGNEIDEDNSIEEVQLSNTVAASLISPSFHLLDGPSTELTSETNVSKNGDAALVVSPVSCVENSLTSKRRSTAEDSTPPNGSRIHSEHLGGSAESHESLNNPIQREGRPSQSACEPAETVSEASEPHLDEVVREILRALPKPGAGHFAESLVIQQAEEIAAEPDSGGMSGALAYLLGRAQLYRQTVESWPANERRFAHPAQKFFGSEQIFKWEPEYWGVGNAGSNREAQREARIGEAVARAAESEGAESGAGGSGVLAAFGLDGTATGLVRADPRRSAAGRPGRRIQPR